MRTNSQPKCMQSFFVRGGLFVRHVPAPIAHERLQQRHVRMIVTQVLNIDSF